MSKLDPGKAELKMTIDPNWKVPPDAKLEPMFPIARDAKLEPEEQITTTARIVGDGSDKEPLQVHVTVLREPETKTQTVMVQVGEPRVWGR